MGPTARHSTVVTRRNAHAVCYLALGLVIGLAPLQVRAQFVSSELPSLQGGDYGNGAASSGIVGSAFMARGGAAPVPAIAYGIPVAYGADGWGVFGTVGYQRGLRGARDFNDGAVFGGFGVGDAWRYVGLEATVAIYDLVGDPFKERSLSVKLHRQFGWGLAAAAGVENAWQAGDTDGGRSAYGVVSHTFTLSSTRVLQSVTLTAGVGNGRFNPWSRVEDGENRASVFGSAAVRITRWAGLFTTWTGQNLNAGLSLAPLQSIPLIITPVALDLDRATDDDPRFAVGVGGAYTIRGRFTDGRR